MEKVLWGEEKGEFYEEGIREVERALELDPMSPVLTTELGWPYGYMGDYERQLVHASGGPQEASTDSAVQAELWNGPDSTVCLLSCGIWPGHLPQFKRQTVESGPFHRSA